MNTTQLIEAIAKNTKAPKAQAKRMLNTFISSVQTEVKKGNRVTLAGFGTFEKGKRKARMGRNPQTGERIKIAAKKYPKFRPGTGFKSVVQ
jgi:DNA-binding protein HU-beta